MYLPEEKLTSSSRDDCVPSALLSLQLIYCYYILLYWRSYHESRYEGLPFCILEADVFWNRKCMVKSIPAGEPLTRLAELRLKSNENSGIEGWAGYRVLELVILVLLLRFGCCSRSENSTDPQRFGVRLSSCLARRPVRRPYTGCTLINRDIWWCERLRG